MKRQGFLFVLCGILSTSCGSIVSTRKAFEASEDKPTLAYYLPTGSVTVSGTYNKDTQSWDLTATPRIEADPEPGVFYLSRDSKWLFSDDVTIQVDATTGLLKSVNAKSTDETATLATDLISSIAGGVKFARGLASHALEGNATLSAALGNEPTPLCKEFDKKVHELNSSVVLTQEAPSRTLYLGSGLVAAALAEKAGIGFGSPAAPVVAAIAEVHVKLESADTVPLNTSGSESTLNEGIAVRWPAIFNVNVSRVNTYFKIISPPSSDAKHAPEGDKQEATGDKRGPTGDKQRATGDKQEPTSDKHAPECYQAELQAASATRQVILPDSSGYSVMKLRRPPVVEATTTIELTNGMVSSVHEIKPSTVVGVIGIPKSILTTLAPIPIEIRQNVTSNIQQASPGKDASAAAAK